MNPFRTALFLMTGLVPGSVMAQHLVGLARFPPPSAGYTYREVDGRELHVDVFRPSQHNPAEPRNGILPCWRSLSSIA